ncbi:hypothetical protein JTE88_08585 [Arcanobacterium phocisimile]|uniref:Tetratricopeptide repeat-containing protein n=1 Tax=Arcanobacterium phocisimile TaxID=1302235 RepID=A0ABX7IHA5_9ACTO|nr:hypothetical protein [Arcanobacterium phocisimile]QRV02115.1 hypothetical protein JTE88_08585 [Arcanobacterium phocisimile]
MASNNNWVDDGVDELTDLIQRAEGSPWGKTCSALWAQAAKVAEDRGDMKMAVRCYVELVTAYVQGGESTRVIAPFAWLERNFRDNPQWFDDVELPGYSDGLIHQLGWYYKYVFSAARELPNVSVVQTEQILQRMHDFYQQQSDPQRAWYFRNYEMYRRLGEQEKAEGFYQQWLNADRSELSDCALCDPGHEVDYYARLEQWDKAIEIGEEALGAESQCSNQPEQLLSDLLLPWLYSGRDDKAWAAHLRAYRRYQQSATYLQNLDQQLVYLAVSGRAGRPERLERGLTIVSRHIPWIKEAESPRVLLDFAATVTLMLDSFDGERDAEVLDVTLPGAELPWASAPQVERPTIRQARDWFYQLALDLTEQFVQRPGHPHPEREMERLNEILNPLPAPEPTVKSAIPDVSGMKISEALSASSASDVVDDEELSTLESEPGLSADQLSGPWKDMSLSELLTRDAEFGSAVSSIYWMQALERVVAEPQLLDADLPDLSDAARSEWEQLRLEIRELLYEEDESPYRIPDVISDPAFKLIAQAEQFMDSGDYMEAAQTADEALGADTADPLGARLRALRLLAQAAQKAGYIEEAIEPARELLNISSAAQLPYRQSVAAVYLVQLLGRRRRWEEMAEVAQNALDVLERQHLGGVVLPHLHLALAQASGKMEQSETAALHLELGAQTMPVKDQDAHTQALTRAAQAYREAHRFPDSIRVWQQVLALVEDGFAQASTVLDELTIADNDADAIVQAEKDYNTAVRQVCQTLYQFSESIGQQPGQVPDEDVALLESMMERLRTLVTDPNHTEFLKRSPQWYEADWQSDMGHMYMLCYKYGMAESHFQASIAGFEQLNQTECALEVSCRLAHMYLITGQLDQASELITQISDAVAEPKFAGKNVRSYARQLKQHLNSLRDGY